MALLTFLAVVLRILANPVANVFQKNLTANGNHPLVVNFLSYAGLSVLCIPIAVCVTWSQLPSPFWLYAALSGMAGATGNGFLVRALQKGELSVLGPINAYKSVVGMIAGIFLLAEIPNPWGLAGTVLIIWGSYFVLDTTEDKFSWSLLKRKEIQYRFWALLLTAIEAVMLKKVILFSSVNTAFVIWCWAGAFFSFWVLPFYRLNVFAKAKQAKTSDATIFFLLILCLGTMQFTTNFVLGHMPVGYALALFQLSTIVSVLLGHRLFYEQDIRKKLLGSVIMILGSLFIILLKGKG